jgi:hypothetical protein
VRDITIPVNIKAAIVSRFFWRAHSIRSFQKPCLHICPMLLLSSDKVGQPTLRDVCHHEAFSLFTPPRTFTLSHAALHTRRSLLPLNVFEHEWAIHWYLHRVSVVLQNCRVPLYVPSLICSDPRSAISFTRFCLPSHMCTVSKIRGDMCTRCPALFTPAMAVSKICFPAMTPTIS